MNDTTYRQPTFWMGHARQIYPAVFNLEGDIDTFVDGLNSSDPSLSDRVSICSLP